MHHLVLLMAALIAQRQAKANPIMPTFELQNPDEFRGAPDIDLVKIYSSARRIIAETSAITEESLYHPFLVGTKDTSVGDRVLYTFPPPRGEINALEYGGNDTQWRSTASAAQVQFGLKVPLQPTATFLTGQHDLISDIHADWLLGEDEIGGAFFFLADADVDCDGQAWKCPHNPDGQSLTTWGALNAYTVPFTVIPQSFVDDHPGLRKNSLVAVICPQSSKSSSGLQLFYSILGDTNGDSPEVIGEMSMALAHACFPKDGLDGGSGHTKQDVLYIPFVGDGSVLHGVTKYAIDDFTKLRDLGDSLIRELSERL